MAAKHREPNKSVEVPANTPAQTTFSALFGCLLGLALLKFCNPGIMEHLVTWPTNIYEWFLTSWPIVIGYWLLAATLLAGLVTARWKTSAPLILVAMPAAWLVWQIIAGTQTESMRLTQPTVIHFVACAVCFYLGHFALNGVPRLWPFWTGLLLAFFLVLAYGLDQHFGGLDESRRYWIAYVYPKMTDVEPGLWKKMQGNRIFSTLFYPNTLAEAILMLFPVTLAVLWAMHERFTVGARAFLMSAVTVGALGCLFWSGSKSGWLIALVLGTVAAMYSPLKRQTKVAIVATVLILGLAGFVAKNLGYFRKGATSVNARFDYWQAALKTTAQKPIFGNGPGAFGKAYERLKRPESEMSQMTHNDYLEQACDSGLPGFLAYAIFVIGTLYYTWRNAIPGSRRKEADSTPSLPRSGREGRGEEARSSSLPSSGERAGVRGRSLLETGNLESDVSTNWIKLCVWLGLLGWALQSFVEFGLYIPAISWLAFALMGWLLGQSRAGKPSAG